MTAGFHDGQYAAFMESTVYVEVDSGINVVIIQANNRGELHTRRL